MIVVRRAEELWRISTRRDFLRVLGLGGTILLLPSLFSACSDDDSITAPVEPVALDLTTDTGMLNYAFVLEQLEAAFYSSVVESTTFSGMSVEQREVMSDLRNHEVAHRELLRATLGSAAIGDLSLNEATVAGAISSTANILTNAEAFEDLGVSAYNGAGKYLRDASTLLLAGKIASVEARHAAAIRDLREGSNLAGTPANTRFAGDDVVDTNGLDLTREPSVALTRVGETELRVHGHRHRQPADARPVGGRREGRAGLRAHAGDPGERAVQGGAGDQRVGHPERGVREGARAHSGADDHGVPADPEARGGARGLPARQRRHQLARPRRRQLRLHRRPRQRHARSRSRARRPSSHSCSRCCRAWRTPACAPTRDRWARCSRTAP